MMVTDGQNPQSVEEQSDTDIDFLENVAIRNIWALWLYASGFLKSVRVPDRVVFEELDDDDPYELFARILCFIVEHRLHRSLSSGYIRRAEDIRHVRGRIDFGRTERRQLLKQAKIACRYNEMTLDTARNRYACAALLRVASRIDNSDKELATRCRSLANRMQQMGVQDKRPSDHEISSIRFSHHDAEDELMIAIARLVFDRHLPTDDVGENPIKKSIEKMERKGEFFEKAIRGFYEVHLKGWSIESNVLRWPLGTGESDDGKNFLPSMKTDICLSKEDRHIVIDTKCKTALRGRRFGSKKSFRSSDIYQIYAYLRSQEGETDEPITTSTGILLYPVHKSDPRVIDEWVSIQGHKIRFVTIDLDKPLKDIRDRLLEIVLEPPWEKEDTERV